MPLPKRILKDMTGQRFGKLTVLNVSDQSIPGKMKWFCKCDCGNFTHSVGWSLRRGKTLSCGCTRLAKSKYTNKEKARYNFPMAHINNVYLQYRNSAKRKGLTFTLSIADVSGLIARPCRYCGQSNSNTMTRNGMSFTYNGIDRKDNTEGYTDENSTSCCKTCNMMKRDMPYTQWIEWLNRVVEHRKEYKK